MSAGDGRAAAPAPAAARGAPAAASELRLSLLTASVYAAIGIHLPFFPIWLAWRGLSAPQIAEIAAVPPLIRLVANLVLPPRADRSGDIPGMLTLCALGTTCAYASLGLIDGFWLILGASLRSPLRKGRSSRSPTR